VPTVSELQAQARTCEEQGDPIQALAIYRDLLHYLARSDAPGDEADVHRRVGDLRLQMRQPARAFAAYRQAAECYARLGSAEEIKTLCAQMIDVVPAAGDSYARFARRLRDHGHVDSALDVVREFGRMAGLDWVSDGVSSLAGRSNEEMQPLLDQLLNDIDRDTPGHALAAQRATAEPLSEPAEVGGSAPVDTVDASVPTEATPTERAEDRANEEHGDMAGTEAPPAGSVFAIEEPVAEAPDPRSPNRDDAKPVSVASDAIVTAPRVWSQTVSSPPTARRFPWRNVGVAAGVAGAAGLVIVGIASIGGERGAASPPPPAMAAALDTSPGSIDAPSASLSPEREPEATFTPAVPPAPVQPDPVLADATPLPLADTTLPRSAPDTSLGDGSDSTVVLTGPIIVDSLTILSVVEIEFRGQSGFRVVHLLDSGAEFIVESFPVDSNTARSYPLGTVIMNVIPPDTTVSIVRFDERYLVFASGVAPRDSVRALIDLLRVQEPSN